MPPCVLHCFFPIFTYDCQGPQNVSKFLYVRRYNTYVQNKNKVRFIKVNRFLRCNIRVFNVLWTVSKLLCGLRSIAIGDTGKCALCCLTLHTWNFLDCTAYYMSLTPKIGFILVLQYLLILVCFFDSVFFVISSVLQYK